MSSSNRRLRATSMTHDVPICLLTILPPPVGVRLPPGGRNTWDLALLRAVCVAGAVTRNRSLCWFPTHRNDRLCLLGMHDQARGIVIEEQTRVVLVVSVLSLTHQMHLSGRKLATCKLSNDKLTKHTVGGGGVRGHAWDSHLSYCRVFHWEHLSEVNSFFLYTLCVKLSSMLCLSFFLQDDKRKTISLTCQHGKATTNEKLWAQT